MSTTPMAKPTGHRRGSGAWVCSRLGSKFTQCWYWSHSTRTTSFERNYDVLRGFPHGESHESLLNPVFRPARRDQLADLLAHLDLRRPLAGALSGTLRRRIDSEIGRAHV